MFLELPAGNPGYTIFFRRRGNENVSGFIIKIHDAKVECICENLFFLFKLKPLFFIK
ncbi:hypothetical protein CLV42_1239 [Chitinophaga ginsengisoli]|uniref:Uncharacterized protein n=1 Tax=Chitinophaga ginsengisoli TaxID=363837 RepID=A0A2P8FID1_9BACT|nr:hypothetical protein CLV42_1239 [Chitinophaga ginsengisoli]